MPASGVEQTRGVHPGTSAFDQNGRSEGQKIGTNVGWISWLDRIAHQPRASQDDGLSSPRTGAISLCEKFEWWSKLTSHCRARKRMLV
jgi:hypothetical protein